MVSKNIANSSELQKKKEVFLTKEVRGRRAQQIALFSGLTTVLTMLVVGKDGAISGNEILVWTWSIIYLILVLVPLIPQKYETRDAVSYEGSLEELLIELYQYGFELKEKIGAMHVFTTNCCFIHRLKIFVKVEKTGCKLYGSYPKELIKLNVKYRGA